MSVTRRLAAVTTVLVLVAAACGSDKSSSGTSSTTTVATSSSGGGTGTTAPKSLGKLRIVQVDQFANGQAEAAKGLGLFEAAGIDAQFTFLGNTQAVTQALIAGDADIIIAAATTVPTLRAQGIQVQALAGGTTFAGTQLLVRKGLDAPIEPRAVMGRNIGTLGPAVTLLFQELLSEAGAGPDGATFVTLTSNQAELAALQAGQIDFVDLSQPFTQSAVDQGAKLWMDLGVTPGSKGAAGVFGNFVMAKSDWIASHAELAGAVSEVIGRVNAAVRKDPTSVVDGFLKVTQATPPDREQFRTVVGPAALKGWQPVLDNAVITKYFELVVKGGLAAKAPSYADAVCASCQARVASGLK